MSMCVCRGVILVISSVAYRLIVYLVVLIIWYLLWGEPVRG